MISIFAEDSGVHVYCSPCWWSDSWDGLEYGGDVDFSKPFLPQLDELFHRVPIMTLYGLYTTLVNSDYTNMVGHLKNCYMVTYSDHCEDATYGSFVNWSKNCVDNLMAERCELCYETINCSKCYRTFFSVDCEGCSDVWFSKNCAGCNNCFGCVNLRNKSYHIFNEPYSKEEYEKKLKELYPDSLEKIEATQKKVEALWKEAPQKFMHGWRNTASSGDYLTDTKNAKDCFIGFDMEDSRYCTFVTGKLTDAYDFTNYGENSSKIYETLQAGDQVYNIKFSHWAITNCQNMEYSLFCVGSKDLFGCVGLKKRQYCIFNKQYSKEGYEELVAKIKSQMTKAGEYGEFFPISISPFGYNETTAQEFFPLTKEQALAKGYTWRDPVSRDYKIGGDVVACENAGKTTSCTTAFKLVPQELQFYERMNFPVPKLCPNCRHERRLAFRNPMKLWSRQCAKCSKEIQTSYSPERPEIVYCESCYQQEII